MTKQKIKKSKLQKRIDSLKTGLPNIDKLVEFLIINNYDIERADDEYDPYIFFTVNGHGIKGGFASANDETYWSLNGRFSFDKNTHFNKYADCPFAFPIPEEHENDKREYILSKMKFLKSLDNDKKILNEYPDWIDYEYDYSKMPRNYKRYNV